MRNFFVLWRKEMSGFFLAPIAYVFFMIFLGVIGFLFYQLSVGAMTGPAGLNVLQLLFAWPFFWAVLLVIAPVITMRLIAEERRAGTLESLLTAPVADLSVVLGKYAAALTFYAMLWAPVVLFPYLLKLLSADMPPIDPACIAASYAGLLLIGIFHVAIGIFASALTRNQVVAAITAFAISGLLVFAGFLEVGGADSLWRQIGGYVSSYAHLYDFARGVLDSRPVVFNVTGAVVFLFLAVRALGARSWK